MNRYEKARQEALKKYYENPNRCLNCNKVIEVKEHEKITEVRTKRKFCDRSCSAIYNNKQNPKRKATPHELCLNCGTPIAKDNEKYCSSKCQRDHDYKDYIQKWKNGEVTGYSAGGNGRVSAYIRRYLFEKYDNKCSRCGWGETNPYTGSIPLEVEHIDGDHKNNKEENLDLICPNCHSLTKTYRGANRGNGRPITWKRKT